MLIHLINTAKSCILALWKQETPQRLLWFSNISDIYSMQSLTTNLRGGEGKFRLTWFLWSMFTFIHLPQNGVVYSDAQVLPCFNSCQSLLLHCSTHLPSSHSSTPLHLIIFLPGGGKWSAVVCSSYLIYNAGTGFSQ